MTSAATSADLDFSTVENNSAGVSTNVENTDGTNSMGIVHSVIASVGIVTNLTVILIFLKHSKLRRKIPNICIINQVGFYFVNWREDIWTFNLQWRAICWQFWGKILWIIPSDKDMRIWVLKINYRKRLTLALIEDLLLFSNLLWN